MLSGYPHKLYDQTLAGWTRYELKIDNKVSGASKKREMMSRFGATSNDCSKWHREGAEPPSGLRRVRHGRLKAG